jgi:hypothetical protein
MGSTSTGPPKSYSTTCINPFPMMPTGTRVGRPIASRKEIALHSFSFLFIPSSKHIIMLRMAETPPLRL